MVSQIKTCHFQLIQCPLCLPELVLCPAGAVVQMFCAVLLPESAVAPMPRQDRGTDKCPSFWGSSLSLGDCIWVESCLAAITIQQEKKQTFLIYVCRNVSKQNTLRESDFLMDGNSSLQYSLTLAYDSYLIYFVFRQSSHSTTPSCLLNQHQPDQERPLTNPFLQILSHFQTQPYLNSFSLFIS